MPIAVQFLGKGTEPAWREYVNSHPDATIYHTLEWRDILYDEYRFEPVYLIAREGGRVVGVLPMFLIKNLRGRRLVSLPFSIYGGPIGETKDAISSLLRKSVEMVKEGVANSVEMKPFQQSDLAENAGLTTLLWGIGTVMDLGISRDKSWDGLTEKFNVQKAEKKGLSFFLTDGERLQEFYRLQLMTRKRLGLPTPSLRYYASFFEKMPGMVKLAIVEKNGGAIAGDIFFIFKDNILLVLNASDWSYRNCKPNDFMIWNIIKWSIASGIKSLDHGPAFLGDKGLLHFKRKWGGRNVKVFRYYCPAGVKEEAQTTGSRLFRMMPLSIAGLVGPRVIKLFGS